MAPAVLLGVLSFATLFLAGPAAAQGQTIPIVDVHNQYDGTFTHQAVLDYMDRYGIGRMILSPHAGARDHALVQFGEQNAHRLTVAARSKVASLNRDGDATAIVSEAGRRGYGAMQEILIYHQDKAASSSVQASQVEGREVNIGMESRAVAALVELHRRRGWPFLAHIEFAGPRGRSGELMAQFERLIVRHRDVAFALMHRGQLGHDEAKRLIAAHPNVHFVLSHSSEARKEGFGFTAIFSNNQMHDPWRELIVAHPDRFVLSFDSFSGPMWADFMARESVIWHQALAQFPPEVAHAVGHENAERLWRLPPTLAITPSVTTPSDPSENGGGKAGGRKKGKS